MAREGRYTSSLSIQKRDSTSQVYQINYRPPAGNTIFDVSGTAGPTPGSIPVSISGTDISLSALSGPPGWMRVYNQDTTNYVIWGPYDPDTDVFYPICEIMPGEEYAVRLYRFFLRESTGTGTLPGGYNSTLRFQAHTATCQVTVDVFDR